MSTSVNPTFIQNNILYENSNSGDTTGATAGTNGNDYVNSANFMEIRKPLTVILSLMMKLTR